MLALASAGLVRWDSSAMVVLAAVDCCCVMVCDVRLVSLINFATLSSTACLDGWYLDGWDSDGWYSDGWYCGLELWEG